MGVEVAGVCRVRDAWRVAGRGERGARSVERNERRAVRVRVVRGEVRDCG